jgi:2-amino-4-hydroxy-6-hydroxymethyldihydropteridine diphosphokinase
MAELRQALVGAGANLGDRLATLAAAVTALRCSHGVHALETSSVYETAPVGLTAQPKFLNLVAGIETTLTPEALLHALQTIEQAHGRVRIERWGPRTLDLDLLAFEAETRATASLTLPHPRMLARAFVLVPLHELLRSPRFAGDARWEKLKAAAREIPDASEVTRFAAPLAR